MFLKYYRIKLNASQSNLNDVSKVLENATLRIYHSNINLEELRNKVGVLKNKTATLKTNTTQLQESNVEGIVMFHTLFF